MKTKNKVLLIIISIVLFSIITGIFISAIHGHYRINKMSKMSFNELLLNALDNNEKTIITIGIIQNEEENITLYGKNCEILPQFDHIYEIGSITKTFTVSLLFKAINEGKIELNDTIDKYLDLPQKSYYPTIRRLVTHTSGYKSHYYDGPWLRNLLSFIFSGKNPFYNISIEQLIDRIGKIDLNDTDYGFQYSNFGISIIGVILSKIYNEPYPILMTNYLRDEFGLYKTNFSDNTGDLGNYWQWMENDAYMPAGALTTTINDMLKYAHQQLAQQPDYLSCSHKVMANINATSANNKKMNVNMDSICAAWIKDTGNNIIWHNGGTGAYNSFIGFDLKNQISVVVLANSPHTFRISALYIGMRLLQELQRNNIID